MAEEKKDTVQITDPRMESMTMNQLKDYAEKDLNAVGAGEMKTKAQVMALILTIEGAKNSQEPVVDVIKDNVKQDDQKYKSKAQHMKEKLEKQLKVRFMIPLRQGEKKGSIETVILNGYRLNILKGVMVDVPQQIAEVLEESYQMTAEAGKQFLLERDDEVKEALQ